MSTVETTVAQYYEFGPFRVSTGEHRFYRNGVLVLLPPKEYELLLLLLQNAGRVMDRETLIKALWPNTVVEEANLNVHISALRKVLAESPHDHRYIETLPRLGYRFIAPVRKVNERENEPGDSGLKPDAIEMKVGLAKEAGSTDSGQSTLGQQGWTEWFARARTVLTIILSILGVLMLAFVGMQIFQTSRLAQTDDAALVNLNALPLTTYPGRELQPAFSPDGKQLAFVWGGESEANADIYVRRVEGGNWVRLTNQPGDEVNPVWSPDGGTIAFYRSSTEGDGIFLIPSLGGAERKLIDTWANRFGFGPHTWLDWSPDGKWLVVSDKSSAAEPFSLFLISPETGEKQRLTFPPTSVVGDCSPAFSPDSRFVGFVRVSGAVVGEVYRISLAGGGEPKQLTFAGSGASTLAWTLDGREIVFSKRYSGKSFLFRIPADGGSSQWLTFSGSDAQFPAFSHHQNRLAWTQNTSNTDIFRLALKNSPRRADVTSRTTTNLIASTAIEVSPRYSPDGRRIVFVSGRSGSDEIWLCGSEGENPIQLTSFRGPLAGSPCWSPDGRQIAFDCRPEGNPDIFIVNSEGGQPRRLTDDPAEDVVPAWSRDGRWVYFTSNRSGGLQIWKMPASGGAAVQITKNGGFEPQESPDGQWLYFTRDRGSSAVWRIPVNGGEETPVFDFREKNYSRSWTVANQGVYFVVAESLVQSSIRFANSADGSVRTVASFDGNVHGGVSGLSISPDGKWLIYPLVTQRGSDLMMIKNFR